LGIACSFQREDLHAFSIVNEDQRYEEKEMLALGLERYGVRHTAIPNDTRNFLEDLKKLVQHHGMPVATITYFAQWRLMRKIHEASYKVSVSGTGADELFSGYYDHHLAYFYDIRGDADLLEASKKLWREKVKPFVRNPYLSRENLFLENRDFRDHIYLKSDFFASFLKERFQEAFQEQRYCKDLLRNRMMNELKHESVPVILNEDDLNAMSFSIENRSPFLDRELFECLARVPTRHLVSAGLAKSLLRDAVRGTVPDAILDNPRKVGFNAPLRDYLGFDERALAETLLNESPVFDILQREKVAALLFKRELPNSESKFLFNFLNVKFFLETWA
jgi:asparagine synthase (glutamine-hydrolysing)